MYNAKAYSAASATSPGSAAWSIPIAPARSAAPVSSSTAPA